MRRTLAAPAALVLGLALAGPRLRAAPQARFELTVDSIMRGPRLVGYPPSGLRFSGDSRKLYFEWRRPGEEEASSYVVARDGGEPRKLSEEERRLAPAPSGVFDHAQRRQLSVQDGDVVLVDSVALTRRQITRTTAAESHPRWARSETCVTFVRDENLFIVPVDASDQDLVVQLTDVSPQKKEPKLTDSQKLVKEQEARLIEHVRDAERKRKRDEERQKRWAPPRFELADGQSVPDLALDPDDVHVFLLVADKAQGARRSEVPEYVTESGYTEEIPGRTDVGDAQPRFSLAVLSLKTGKSVFVDAAFAQAAPDAGSGAASDGKPKPREVRFSMPVFSRDGKLAVAAARAADNKDRWLVAIDPETGAARVLDRLHDDAWVRELGSGFGAPRMGFLPDDHTLWFASEKTGFMQLYSLDATAATPEPRALSSGRFEITAVEPSLDGDSFYVTSTESSAAERQLYVLPATGGARTRITEMPGANLAVVAPDGASLGIVHSYANVPPEVYVMQNRPGAPPRRVTTTPTEEWQSFHWADPRLVSFEARDGVQVPARLYLPEMLGARRDPSRPGVVFIHGAGYLQNAHRYWSDYYREYMFHNLLAQRGYVVLDVDYRGSAGYGRDWRVAIYRHMGGKDLDDIVDGARYLVAKQGVDPHRLGVYGGSYGGFLTLMAMFNSPDTFAAGAALRPVTDWAHYNHPYTSDILNLPQSDPEAYRQSSPIEFASGLKGALLICHGMADTNVHFQDSVRLVQRLIELRKTGWQLAVFPVENHGFQEETSWADEYRRILELFETRLRRPR
jgi:dipeptidyl aminopeptidase/acylaminoacyl peptidase